MSYIDDLINKAKATLNQEERKNKEPDPDEVQQSEEEWKRKYGDFEQKGPLEDNPDVEKIQKSLQEAKKALLLATKHLEQAEKSLGHKKATKEEPAREYTPTPRGKTVEQCIVDMYKQGIKVSDITSTFEVSYGWVYTILRKNGISPSRSGAESTINLSQAEAKAVVKDYLRRMAVSDIFSRYHINKNTLYVLLDANRIPRRQGRTVKRG